MPAVGLHHVLHVQQRRRRQLRRARVFRPRLNTYMLDYDEADYITKYRMGRADVQVLLELVRPTIESPTLRNHAISAELQVLCALRYLASGALLSVIADAHGISKPTASRIITRVCNALNECLEIKFPSVQQDINQIKFDFFQMANFPNTLGCVDGSLIPIRTPAEDEHLYICRKRFHAINIMGVCDANKRFINVVAKWPGSCHDFSVFENSELGRFAEQNNLPGFLLGDSGYATKPYLMTPLRTPSTDGERRYNQSLCKTRVCIEQAFGLLKSRFRCLDKSTGGLPFTPQKACKVIMTCCKLHNYCIQRGVQLLDLPIIQPDDDFDDYIFPVENLAPADRNIQATLIANRF